MLPRDLLIEVFVVTFLSIQCYCFAKFKTLGEKNYRLK